MTTAERLNAMPLGEAMFTQRAIRRFKKDPIPDGVLEDIMQATIRAPNGGNNQQWHFILVKDAEKRAKLAELYHEAWWAKRADQGIMGPEDIPSGQELAAVCDADGQRDRRRAGDGAGVRHGQGSAGHGVCDSVSAKYAAGGAGLRRRRHDSDAASGSRGAGTRPVRHPRRGAGGLLYAAGLSAGRVRVGAAQAPQRSLRS